MLILSRNVDESIVIDDKIKVKIISIQGKQVKLGIEAPKEMRVNRHEIQKLQEKVFNEFFKY